MLQVLGETEHLVFKNPRFSFDLANVPLNTLRYKMMIGLIALTFFDLRYRPHHIFYLAIVRLTEQSKLRHVYAGWDCLAT